MNHTAILVLKVALDRLNAAFQEYLRTGCEQLSVNVITLTSVSN